MADGHRSSQTIELKAGGPDDPEGMRAAAVLGAYFDAEHSRLFCRLLWRRSAVICLVAWLLAATTPLLPRTALVATLILFGTLAVAAGVAEWRMQGRLHTFIQSGSSE